MKAVVYTRVSTDEQAGVDKTSLDVQLADCQRYAADKGYDVDRVYREVESGANRQRPMFREMLALAEAGAVDVLLAWRPDRFQRNMGDAQDLIDACVYGGVRVECATQYVDLDTIPQDTAFGARERKMISVRTRAGKLGSARQGRIPSKLPYGYRRTDEGKAVLQADEAAVVKRIFRMATEEDRGIRYIADVLDVAGVTPPGGRRWWPNAVARILSCTTYTGMYHYGRREHVKVHGKGIRISDLPEADHIAIAVPVIVTQATWDRAQTAGKRRKRSRSASVVSRQKLNYLLAGLLSCACGSTMNGTSNGKRRHYVCRSHLTRPKALADWPTGCRAKPYVNAEALDERVWAELSAFIADPWTLADLPVDDRDIAAELEAAEKALQRVEAEDDRLLRLYVSGRIDEAAMDRQRRYIDERRDAAAALVDHLKAQMRDIAHSTEAAEAMTDLVDRVAGTLDSMDTEQRIGLLRQVVEGITLDEDNAATIRVTVRLPESTSDSLRLSRSTPCW